MGWAWLRRYPSTHLDIYYINRFQSTPLSVVNKGLHGMAGVCVPGVQGVISPRWGQGGWGWGVLKLQQ